MTTNGYLGNVLAAHEDENADFLMIMATDIEDRMSVLKDDMQAMISNAFQEFKHAPRQARRMRASLNVICERVEALDKKIKGKAVPKLENSISEMTGLSKRLIEISLLRKVVDDLVQLNDKFSAAQDFQREKKYFDASKAYEMLFKVIEDSSDQVKRLKIYKALQAITSTTIVNIQDHMTNTLMECFQCKVTTGIDASKMSYYTLKVDKNRIEDFEDSFKGLHYLKKLDPYFRDFASWVHQNIILPIIMHCCSVTTENEDGKYVVLKVEADFTMPKCSVLKVFENLTFALTFLKTYLCVKVGENSTIMNEMGKITSNDFCSALINHCLADTIPSHSNQLEEYKGVISATESFHTNLINIGYLDGTNLNLIAHTMNAEKLCATKTSKVLLSRARDIIKKDLYDAMEVEIVPKLMITTPKKEVKEEKIQRPVFDTVIPTARGKEELDKSMAALMDELHKDFLSVFGLEEYTPAKGHAGKKTIRKKKQPRPLLTPSKEKQSPVKEEPPISYVEEDLEEIRSPVKVESEQAQSNPMDDSEREHTSVKLSNEIIEDLISVATSGGNVHSVLPQEASPGKKDLGMDDIPAHNDSKDSASEQPQMGIRRQSTEDPSDATLQKQSNAMGDLEEIRSPVKVESEQAQSNPMDDSEREHTSVKLSNEIIEDLISVATSGGNVKSVLSLEASPGKKDLGMDDIPAHNDSKEVADSANEQRQMSMRRQSTENPSDATLQKQSNAMGDLEKITSPVKGEAELMQSKAKKDNIRSPVKEGSEMGDSEREHTSVKLSNEIIEDLIAVATSGGNVNSVVPQEVSPGQKDLNSLLKDDTNVVECSAGMDESPAVDDSEQIADSANEQSQMEDSRQSREDTSDLSENEQMLRFLMKATEDCNTSEDSNSSQVNLGTIPNKPLKAVGKIREDTLDEFADEDIVSDIKKCGPMFETSKEINLDLSGAVFAFPKCQISKSANELTNLLQEVLSDCAGSSKECVRNLFKTARLIIELYCAIAPTYHRKYLETIPQQAALYHNNCMYISHCLLTLGHAQRHMLAKSARMIGSFADQVVLVRKQGASIFLAHMHFQRDQILDIIRNCGLSTLRECSTLTRDTERALRQCLRQLELLNSLWLPVLTWKVYKRSMACLMNSFLDELINRVMTVQDIPAETATSLVMMFGVVITRVQAIFPDPQIVRKFENWEMFQELVLILGANMKFIQERWGNGQGPAALCFSPEQLRQLIRALFQNTERRSAVLAEIH